MPPTVQTLDELPPAARRFVRYLEMRGTATTYLIPAPRGRWGAVEPCGGGHCRADVTLNGSTLRLLYTAGLITYGDRVDFEKIVGRRYREDNYGEPVELTDTGWALVGGRPTEEARA